MYQPIKKCSFLILLSLITIVSTQAQSVPLPEKSFIDFQVKNLGFPVKGTIKGLKGSIKYNAQTPAAAEFHLSADANTLTTENTMRDNHLHGADYFDVAKYPKLTFESAMIVSTKKGLLVNGRLKIKNQERNIMVPVTVADNQNEWVFSGKFSIKRSDYSIGGTSIISDNVEVNFLITTNK